jgi:hypothetical protein
MIRSGIRAVIDSWPDGEVTDAAAALSLAPVAIMGDLMGLPEPDWPMLARLTATSVAPADPHYGLPSGVAATRSGADRGLFGYLGEHVQQRRRTSREDLITLLLEREVEGRRLAPSEVVTSAFNAGRRHRTISCGTRATTRFSEGPGRLLYNCSDPGTCHPGPRLRALRSPLGRSTTPRRSSRRKSSLEQEQGLGEVAGMAYGEAWMPVPAGPKPFVRGRRRRA